MTHDDSLEGCHSSGRNGQVKTKMPLLLMSGIPMQAFRKATWTQQDTDAWLSCAWGLDEGLREQKVGMYLLSANPQHGKPCPFGFWYPMGAPQGLSAVLGFGRPFPAFSGDAQERMGVAIHDTSQGLVSGSESSFFIHNLL